MLFSINRFSESFERDRIQLKDEEAEIEMTGRPLNEAHTCVTLRN